MSMGVVRLECHECGSADCALVGGERADSWIICRACGAHLITLGQLHDEISHQARDFATNSIRKALGMTGWLQDNDEPTGRDAQLEARAKDADT
jgi:hypothetical protein